ncbi:MAG: type II toxin-antitoxin system Phd/YefM family antitoxin [Gammaproteobacteria bacterium]
MELHPQVIEKEGKKEFVVLPFEEYQALTELMHDYEDLRDLREAKEESKGQESIPLHKVISDFGFVTIIA